MRSLSFASFGDGTSQRHSFRPLLNISFPTVFVSDSAAHVPLTVTVSNNKHGRPTSNASLFTPPSWSPTGLPLLGPAYPLLALTEKALLADTLEFDRTHSTRGHAPAHRSFPVLPSSSHRSRRLCVVFTHRSQLLRLRFLKNDPGASFPVVRTSVQDGVWGEYPCFPLSSVFRAFFPLPKLFLATHPSHTG